ncbi:MAG: LysR family transcriptional regulator [Planctomycetia bacterium]|nr:LysR family transcriptional regulator [Planctomycetia bacterium]
MPRPPAKRRTYKELTFQQLRSFSETARLGSLAAAAHAIGLTHPTVREQVLALQAEFRVKLIEPHGRGCHLTPEGRMLAEMVAPIITSTASLRKRFEVARGAAEERLVVAGTPRIFQEDLPAAVDALLKLRPRVRLAFLELRDGQIAQAVEAGAADFGLTTQRIADPVAPGVEQEPGYELETLLVTSKKHPLAKKRSVDPSDLRRYSLISSLHTFSDEPEITEVLDRSRVFDGPAPHVEPVLAATIRTYVERNHGIALLYGRLPRGRTTTLHERSMSRYFGRVPVRFFIRVGTANEELARTFAGIIKKCNPSKSRS